MVPTNALSVEKWKNVTEQSRLVMIIGVLSAENFLSGYPLFRISQS